MSFMAQEKNKKARQTAQNQPEVTDLQTQPKLPDLQTQPELPDLTDWNNTQVRGTYLKKGANLKDLEKK